MKGNYILVGVENREISVWPFTSYEDARAAMFSNMLGTEYVDRECLFGKDGKMKKEAGNESGCFGSRYGFDKNTAWVTGSFVDFDWYIAGPSDKRYAMVEYDDHDISVTWHETPGDARRAMLEAMADTGYIDRENLFDENGGMKAGNPNGSDFDKGSLGCEFMFDMDSATINTNDGGYEYRVVQVCPKDGGDEDECCLTCAGLTQDPSYDSMPTYCGREESENFLDWKDSPEDLKDCCSCWEKRSGAMKKEVSE